MIWDDPWIAVVTAERETTLLPPCTVPPDGSSLEFQRTVDAVWCAFVGTQWDATTANARLQNAWVPHLRDAQGVLRGTCVLRPHPTAEEHGVWILETLYAHRGWGTPLMRMVVAWLWRSHGARGLMFTWELSLPTLARAFLRGWLTAAVEVQWGWTYVAEGCSWCHSGAAETRSLGPPLPLRCNTVTVNDSGQRDGCGYVCSVDNGAINWSTVAKRGGWKRLWMRAATSPGPEWRWTGEIVIVAALGRVGPTAWTSAEI